VKKLKKKNRRRGKSWVKLMGKHFSKKGRCTLRENATQLTKLTRKITTWLKKHDLVVKTKTFEQNISDQLLLQ
jgi:hypothetical protein